MRYGYTLLSLVFLTTGCGDSSSSDDYSYGDGQLQVDVAYANLSTALTIEDIPEGQKDYVVVQVFRGADVIGASRYSSAYPIHEETFGASQRELEIWGLPFNEVLVIEITTYDFAGRATYVGKGQKTLTDGSLSRLSISMKPYGIFLKTIVNPIAKKRAYSFGYDKVELRYELINNTLQDQIYADVDVDVLTAEIPYAYSLGDSIYSSFPGLTTKVTDGSSIPSVDLPDGYRGSISLRLTFSFDDSREGYNLSTSQTVTFTPDYSGL